MNPLLHRYIDRVEASNKTFYMEFRFHSESLCKIDKNHNKIFKEFIKTCNGVTDE